MLNAKERLNLIADIYEYLSFDVTKYQNQDCAKFNITREVPVAWDASHIFAAIATGYKITLNPRYNGVVLLRRNKQLWKRISEFVDLKTGVGTLMGDDKSAHARAEYLRAKFEWEKS